jgi:hypothetical protein
MINKFIVLIAVFFIPINTFAGPTISPLNNMNITDGDSVIIHGTGFGSNPVDIEWLGGASGNIESGAVGTAFSKNKWTVDTTCSNTQSPLYSSNMSHSGSKSIMSSYSGGQYDSGFVFNHGTTFHSVYFTYWVYLDLGINAFSPYVQWKQWRIRPVASNDYGDTNGEIMTSNWYNSDGSSWQAYTMIFGNVNSYTQCYPGGVDNHYQSGYVVPKVWARVEVFAQGSSSPGVADGTLCSTLSIQGSTTKVVKDYEGDITTRFSGINEWQKIVFENFFGNSTTNDRTKTKMYFDDIYMQFGSRAHIEIGDNITYGNCTHREIQIPVKWNPRIKDAEAIKFIVNKGSFNSNQNAFLFVIDANGNPSNGQPITFQ